MMQNWSKEQHFNQERIKNQLGYAEQYRLMQLAKQSPIRSNHSLLYQYDRAIYHIGLWLEKIGSQLQVQYKTRQSSTHYYRA